MTLTERNRITAVLKYEGYSDERANELAEEIDKPSIELTIDRLYRTYSTTIVEGSLGDLNQEDDKSIFDISGLTVNGNKFLIEVKCKPSVSHNQIWDVMCDKAKIDKWHTEEKWKEYDTVFVFNYFNDGWVGIANPKYGYNIEKKKTNRSSVYGNKGQEIQEVITMKDERYLETSDYKRNFRYNGETPIINTKIVYKELEESEKKVINEQNRLYKILRNIKEGKYNDIFYMTENE